jgi:glycine/D-amino acid oxidase-like deaminating enzyme
MITMQTPQRHFGPIPASCDVVVIGGGVIGVSCALELAARGLRVTLCEKGRIAAEQSSRNWGWIRQQGRDLAELPIMMESLSIWKSHAQTLGASLGFAQKGVIYLARSTAEMAEFETWADGARHHGLATDLQSATDLAQRWGKTPWIGGLQTPTDARAEPFVAVPMLADLAAARGVIMQETCAVRHLDITDGRITGVVTEKGRIACDQVVLAGGAWSSLFLRAHGVDIPQLSVLSSVGATQALPEIHAGNGADDRIGFRRRMDGGYSLAPGFSHDFFIGPDAFRHLPLYWPQVKKDHRATRFRPMAPRGFPDAWGQRRRWRDHSPFEAMRILDPKPNLRALDQAARDFGAAFPHLGPIRFVKTWAGMIDMMPDVVPIIDRGPIAGLVIGTGLSGHGFGIGPAVGRVLADLVADRPLGHDLSRFRFARFTDGSVIAPGPSL